MVSCVSYVAYPYSSEALDREWKSTFLNMPCMRATAVPCILLGLLTFALESTPSHHPYQTFPFLAPISNDPNFAGRLLAIVLND